MTKSAGSVSVTRARKELAFGSVLVAALVAVMLVLVAATRPAQAAFPGTNGQIIFDTNRSIVGSDPSTTDVEIISMNANGTGLTQLTVNAVQDFNPAWSPNGLTIAFIRREGDDEIFKMAADGSNQIPLTANASRDFDPAFSSSGKIDSVRQRSQLERGDLHDERRRREPAEPRARARHTRTILTGNRETEATSSEQR